MWAKRIVIILTLVILSGCAYGSRLVTSPATDLSAREAAVLEAALRDHLHSADKGAIIFISLGSMRTNWKNPPPAFLERFSDLPYRLKPVSQARMAKDGEMEAPNRCCGVEGPAARKRSWIYWAEVREWVSDSKVRVDVGVWSGPDSGGGGIHVFELREGKWVSTAVEGGWVS